MKKKVMFIGACVSMMLGFSACSSTDSIESSEQGGGTAGGNIVTLTGGFGSENITTAKSDGTRMTMDEAKTSNKHLFRWEDKDYKNIYVCADDGKLYPSTAVSITSDGRSAKFTFNIGSSTLTGGSNYVIFNSTETGKSPNTSTDDATAVKTFTLTSTNNAGVSYTAGKTSTAEVDRMKNLPIFAYGAISSNSFTLAHKLAYVVPTSMTLYGNPLTNGTLSANSNGLTLAADGTATAKDTSAFFAISTNKVYAVVPGKRFTISASGAQMFTTTAAVASYFYPISPSVSEGNYTISGYYQWDAWSHYVNGSSTYSNGNEGYHPTITTSDVTKKLAENSCISCPSASEIYAYLIAGAYLDDGTAYDLGDGSYSYPPSYTLPNGTTYNRYTAGSTTLVTGSSAGYGLWLPKNSYVKSAQLLKGKGSNYTYKNGDGVSEYNGSTDSDDHFTNILATNANAVRNSGNYFFLPAAGNYYNGSLYTPGSYGYYWSSTPYSNTSYAWKLYFYKDRARLIYDSRYLGFSLWEAQ